jgi:hypothetical protein
MSSSHNNGPIEIPSGSPRRYATRFEPARRDACLAWWNAPADGCRIADEDEDHEPADAVSHHHFALLLDISHTGASVALDCVPDDQSAVWLRLEGDCLTEWTEADVVGVTISARGPHLVRLAFRAPCPFETLRAAVCG